MKRKLFLLVITVIIISTLVSGFLLTFFIKNRYIRNLNAEHDYVMDYIEESYEAMKKRGTYVNDFHFVQNVVRDKEIHVTFLDKELMVLSDSENNSDVLDDKPLDVSITDSIKTFHYIKFDDFSQENKYFSLKSVRLEDRMVYIRLGSSMKELFADVQLIRNYYLLAICVSVVITVVIGFTIVNYINKPITALTAAADQISNGDYSIRVEGTTDDEIGTLSNVFNQMTVSIEEQVYLLNEKNAFLDALIGEMINGVIAIDSHGSITVFNKTCRRLLGVYDDVVGLEELNTNEVVKKGLLYAVNGVSKQHELLLNNKILELHFTPIWEADHMIGALCLMHDLTEKRKLENIRKEFFTNVSHELRTPLTSIIGFIDTLSMSIPKDQKYISEIFTILEAETERLQNLINDMLRISELEDISILANKTHVDIDVLIKQAIEVHEGLAEQKNIKISYEHDQFEYSVAANEELFFLMLTNMLSNGLKYNKQGGELLILLYGDGDNIYIGFEDTGIGIEKEDIGKIFNRFYRVEKSRNRKVGGAGLGLSIVQKMVDILGGSIRVESKIEKGSKFVIQIPNTY